MFPHVDVSAILLYALDYAMLQYHTDILLHIPTCILLITFLSSKQNLLPLPPWLLFGPGLMMGQT